MLIEIEDPDHEVYRKKIVARLRRTSFPFLALVVLLAACGESGSSASEDGADSVTTVTATTMATTAGEATDSTPLLIVAFDGASCTYDGPVEIAAGPARLSYTNRSDQMARIAFNQHTGDQTVQNAIDHFGPSPSSRPCPAGNRDVVRTAVAPGDTDTWVGERESSTYHIVCYQNPPLSVWFGTGLTVEG